MKLSKLIHRFFSFRWLLKGKRKRSFDYNQLFSRYNNLEVYLDFFTHTRNANANFSKKKIELIDKIEFGSPKNDVINALGKPQTTVRLSICNAIEIIQYKTILNEEKVKLQFHFYNYRLFLYAEVYPYIYDRHIPTILQPIFTNLDLENSYAIEHKINIKDSEENFIFTQKDVEFSVYYLDAKSVAETELYQLKEKQNKAF